MEAAFIIAFREGMEAFLILGITLAFLKKLSLEAIRGYAWGGVIVGVIASLVLGFMLSVIIDGFESEALQYNISLFVLALAIVLLTYMIFWMQNSFNEATLQAKMELSSNHKVLIFVLIFSAIFREGLETVIFSLALVMNGAEVYSIYFGLILGFMLSAMLVWTLFEASVHLPIKQFFTYSSYLIMLIVAGLVALFIKGAQAYEYLPLIHAPLYDSSFLISNDSLVGKFLSVFIGYDAMPSLLQFSGWLLYLIALSTLLYFKQRRNQCRS